MFSPLTEPNFPMLICKKPILNLKLNPVDFLTDIFDIATSVLYDITKDLVTGTIKEVVKEQLEKIVTSKITKFFDPSKPKPEEQELEKIRSQILEEIDTVAKKNPDFKISSGKITLEKKVQLPFSKEDRVERLEKIIAKRRKELGLPPEYKQENLEDDPPDWEPVKNAKVEDSQLEPRRNLNVTDVKEPPPDWEQTHKQETETSGQKRNVTDVKEPPPNWEQTHKRETETSGQKRNVTDVKEPPPDWEQTHKQETETPWQKRKREAIDDIKKNRGYSEDR
jgi:hypothetical protein